MKSMFRWTAGLMVAVSLAGAAACKGKPGAKEGAEAEEGHADEGGKEGIVRLAPEQVQAAGIVTAPAETRAEVSLLDATAQIEVSGDRQARVGPRIAGRIVDLRAGVGDVVARGATLAVVESPDLGRAKADYIAAVANARVTRESADRERALFEKRISSEKDYREAEAAAIRADAEMNAAENRLHALGVSDAELARVRREGHYSSTMAISAPIAGVVAERSATLGQMVEPTDTLFLLMDLREVWILVDVYERDLAQVRVGQNVRVRIAALGDQQFAGKVASVGATIETKTRTAKVRVVLQNPAVVLRPGMFASVVFEGTTGPAGHEAVFVPADAVQRDGKRSLVFVARGPGEFEAREVELGHESEGNLEIEQGVKAGEAVVVRGSFVLKSELKKAELGEADHH